jgi:hypothetical protein
MSYMCSRLMKCVKYSAGSTEIGGISVRFGRNDVQWKKEKVAEDESQKEKGDRDFALHAGAFLRKSSCHVLFRSALSLFFAACERVF